DLSYDRAGRVPVPIDRAVDLAHERAILASDSDLTVIERLWPELTRFEFGNGLQHTGNGCLGDVIAVKAAFADKAIEREIAGGPYRARVKLLHRLKDRHAPCLFARCDRPVERGSSAIAQNSRMNDEACVLGPDRLRNLGLEHGSNDEIRFLVFDRFNHCLFA